MTGLLHKAWRAIAPDYLIITALFAVMAYATLINWPHFALDARYYYAMALHFGGHSEIESRDMVIALMHQLGVHAPMPEIQQLFHWGMVEPRVVLPLIAAPFVALWGFKGFLLVEIAFTYALIIALFYFLSRAYGRGPAFIAAILLMTSHYIMYFSLSLLTEPLTMFISVLLLFSAWQYVRERRVTWLYVLAGLVIIQGFTRQATFVAALAFGCAWLGALVLRKPRRSLGAVALVVSVTAVGVQIIQSLIWPFSQLNQFYEITGTNNLGDALLKLPGVAWNILYWDMHTFLRGDLVLVAILLLTLVSVLIFWRRAESHMIIGAFLGIAVYNVTNGTTTQFRYSLPALAFYLTGIALLVSYLISRTDRRQQYPSVGFETPSDETRSS